MCEIETQGGEAGILGPYTYYWQDTETYSWATYSSGWYTGTAGSPVFYCPRLPIHDGVTVWTLTVEAYAVDAYGYVSPIVTTSFRCRDQAGACVEPSLGATAPCVRWRPGLEARRSVGR